MVSEKTLQRLPLYANYLRTLPREEAYVSATSIASGLGLHQVQVRKDLAAICSGGKPRVGYEKDGLLHAIEEYLWSYEGIRIVLVGMGNLGRALCQYKGFEQVRLHIVAAFDKAPALAGRRVGNCLVRPVEELPRFCREQGVQIGILAVPAGEAQGACELLLAGGVHAIWNFAPTHLTVPEGIQVSNENMAASLAILAKRLEQAQA